MTATIENADLLRQAMDAQGITDNDTRAGLAAICMGESNLSGITEASYSHTDNARIREIFGGRVPADDAGLDALKADDRAFFNAVYGGDWGRLNLGNIQPDDGYDFRGRGFIQLTGRSNYTLYSGRIGNIQILNNPDLANDPANAAALAIAYIKSRYKGGGFEAMMACVGSSSGDVADRKRQYFAQYQASGEFNYQAAAPIAAPSVTKPAAPVLPPASPAIPVNPIPAPPKPNPLAPILAQLKQWPPTSSTVVGLGVLIGLGDWVLSGNMVQAVAVAGLFKVICPEDAAAVDQATNVLSQIQEAIK